MAGRPSWWQQRWTAWWLQRHPPSDTLALTQRNVYIVPTRAGWLFAAMLGVLLLASINYQLNLGYLLTFLLAGVGLSSMHGTHATLRGLQLQLVVGEPVFVGESVRLTITLQDGSSNRRQRARYGIGIGFIAMTGNDAAPAAPAPTTPTWLDVPASTTAQVQLTLPATQRGRWPLPRLVLETRFPFGLFRAWSYWRPASTLLAWPAPETPAPALPLGAAAHGQPAAVMRFSGSSEPDGVRAYRRGDPLQQVLWKKSAQALAGGGDLVSRERVHFARSELVLDWADAVRPTLEQRLSRLAAWVLAAEQAGLRYGLTLPGQVIDPGHGPAHRRQCLDLLADWEAR
ncbi:MAG: DUF58 domain-containing protein [Burkholderiales bacterium]